MGVAGAARMIGKLNASLSVLATCLAATAGRGGVAQMEASEGGGRWGHPAGREDEVDSNQYNVALINFFDPSGAVCAWGEKAAGAWLQGLVCRV